jgi:hypothetical protein
MSRTALPPGTEEELIRILVRCRAQVFGRNVPLAREVRSHGSARADLCLLRAGELISIEAKLLDGHRAIGQALLNTYFADRSYIAVWHQVVTRSLISTALQWGVGVLAVERSKLSVASVAPVARPNVDLRDRVLRATFLRQP